MEESPFDIIAIALELIIVGMLLWFISFTFDVGSQVTKSYQKESDIAESMRVYAAYSKYDGTTVSGADVVAAILMHAADDLAVVVNTTAGNRTYVTAPELASLTEGTNPPVNLRKDYLASIGLDANGAIRSITFDPR